MGFAYTPGLTVAERTVVRKIRRLPLKGQVIVKVGDTVTADTVVAQTHLPGPVRPVNAVSKLGIQPDELKEILLRQEGDTVREGEAFIRTKGFFGLFKSELTAPIDGTIESISAITGQVIFRGAPTPLQKLAYAAGRIVEVQDEESATVEVHGAFIQGIFGVGGETNGEIVIAVDSPDDVLDAARILPEHKAKIIIGGSLVTADAVKAAARVGAAGIVVGGLQDADLRNFLGYELGVAITGEERLGVTIVTTEGFGRIRMAHGTFDLFRKLAGRRASVNGATQIRAGVIRPEVIVPTEEASPVATGSQDDEQSSILQVGTAIRAIRDPYFGRLGCCTGLPVELVELPSQARVRVLEVEFEGGQKAILPRANVELIKT